MLIETMAEKLGLECLRRGEQNRPVTGGYTGDLLSWVMGRAEPGCAWITIMSNVNVAAVASLADVSCVILAEDVLPDAPLDEKFGALPIAVYTTPMSAYEISWRLHRALSEED